MGRIKDRYDELFGETAPYDPIELTDRAEITAGNMQAAAPSASPERTSAIPLYEPDFEKSPAADDSGFMENIARQFGAGVVQTGEMVLGAGEYVARNNRFLDGIVADTVYSGRTGLAGVREDILAGISEEDRQKAAAELLTLDPNRTIWQGNVLEIAESILYKTANALPATLATMIPAIRFARAASPGKAITAMGATEGTMSVGGIQNGIADEILSMDAETLLQESPRFAELLEANGGDADAAKQELITEAQGFAPLVGGATVAAISSVAGRYFTPVFQKGGGAALGNRVATGFAAEAPQEGSQGAAEQLVQNYAAKIYDMDRQLSEGVAEAAAQEALIGGIMGAGAGGAFGERPTAPPPPVDPNAPVQQDLPGIEPGGPEVLPDELDQPSPEPTEDIQAQIEDLLNTDARTGVYIPPGQDPRTYAVPEGLVEMENIDGQGGTLIVQDREVALDARARISQGESRQAVIGSIVGAGLGKPTGPDTLVVQLLDEQGGVARESMVADRAEADALVAEWGPNAAVMTPQEAIGRREALGAGPSAEVQIQEDLFDNTAARGTEAMLVSEEAGPPGQLDLPLTTGRERGVGRVPIPAAKDVERPASILPTEEEDVGVDLEEVSRRQDDIFDGESTFEPSIEDEVRQDIRKDIPFEERAEPIAAVKGSRSFGQAADQLLGRAADEAAQEQKNRIGGFSNPDQLAFDNLEYETAYREAWDALLDAELTIELSNNKRAVEQAKKRKQKLFQELGKIRQVAKPKQKESKGAKFVRAAKAVNPAEVREFSKKVNPPKEDDGSPQSYGSPTAPKTTDENYLGDFEALSRDEIDDLADYTVRHKTPSAKEYNEESFQSAREAYERRDEIKRRYPKRTVTVDVKGTRSLDEEFERAAMFREGREVDSRVEEGSEKTEKPDDTPKPLTGKLSFEEKRAEKKEAMREVEYAAKIDRSTYNTPGKKLKFIRRESEHKRRQDTGQKSVKAATVRRSSAATKVKQRQGETEQEYQKRVARAEGNKKFDSAPLTQVNYPLDESVQDRVERIAKAKQTLADLGKTATRANTELRKLKGKKITEGMDEKTKANFLYARNYLEQLVQFARSIQNSKADSNQNIKLAEGVKNMLDAVPNMDVNTFANKWGDIARKNEFDSLADLKFTNLASMRVPEKRAKTTKKSNSAVFSRARLRKLNEELRTDPLYQDSIKPVLEKMTNYVIDNVSGNATPPYIPTEPEIAEIRFALNMNKDVAKYNPIREQMKRAGFLADEKGNITGYEASDDYLNINAKAKSGIVKPLPPGEAAIAQQLNQGPVRDEARAREDRTDARNAAKRYDKVNGLIQRFKENTAASKITINGIKRQEQRFIRGLKKLGAWRDTGNGIGQININGFSSKTYRLLGPRLDAKTALKNDARATIQRIKEFPIPRTVKPFVTEARATENYDAGVESFLDENDIELFNEAAKPTTYDAEYTGVAERIGEMMTAGKVTGQQVVDTILEIAPQNSFYRNLADRLKQKDLSNVNVTFGTEKDFPRGQLGKFNRKTNRILLNRDALNMANLRADEVYGARVVHTLTHELIHAQTHAAIDSTPRLKQYFEALQRRGREAWVANIGGTLPYGLKVLQKENNQAHEFVTEAFTNHEFQKFLKETPVQPDTGFNLWQALVRAIRATLGLPEQVPNNLFDAIVLTEEILFDDAGFGGSTEGDLYITGDGVVDNMSTHVQDMMKKSVPIWDKVKNAIRNLMTFEQLHDTYAKHFKDGSFGRYMDAWKRRNAAISQNMKVPEALSVKWTKLESTDPDAAQELSRIGTEATIERLTPAKKLSAKERADISYVRLKKYDDLRARFLAMPADAQQLYSEVSSWYKDAAKQEADLLLSASLRGVLTKGQGAKLSTEQFQERFTDEKIKQMVDKDTTKAELADLVDESELDGLVKELQRMASLRTIGFGDYFPLMRYGEYTVYQSTRRPDETFSDSKDAFAKRKELLQEDPTLDVSVIQKGDKSVLRVEEKEFWMFESKTEAQAKAAELGSTVEARISVDGEGTAISSNAGLSTILTSLKGNPAAQAAIKEHYLRSLSDSAFRKHELKRKNRVGVNYDIQHRNLANYLKQSSYYRAQLKYGWRMGEALQDMFKYTRGRPDDPDGMTTEQLQQVAMQVQTRDTMTNDRTELMKAVRAGVNITQFMMLTSPSYWMINATQPWLVTAPIMGGKFGMGQSYAALKHAFSITKGTLGKGVIKSKFGLEALRDPVKTEAAFNIVDQLLTDIKQSGDPRADEYAALIEELRDINIIDINVLTELREIAEGTRGGAAAKVLDASRILAHITEVSNRTVTAIAAYNLTRTNGGSIEEAKQYAADMVSQTQFNYSSENKPPLFQPGGPLKWAAPLMFQFMQWPQHMYALLIRNVAGAMKGETAEVRAAARKSVLGLLGTHVAVGGTVGMALQPIKWALGFAAMAFGDEDEPYTLANAISGRTFDNTMDEVLTELFGDTGGRALSRGLPTLLGTDLSGRMSMGTLYFVDLRGDSAESVLGSLAASFGGATLNQAVNFTRGANKIASGEVWKGVEQVMPKIGRDAIRSVRYYNEGLVNNAGDTVIPAQDMHPVQLFLQSIGFAPDDVAKYYTGQAAIKGAQGYARDRRSRLIKKFVDDGMNNEVMEEVTNFNRAYPSLRITRSTLIRGARSRVERETRYGLYGANIDEKEATDFGPYADPYR